MSQTNEFAKALAPDFVYFDMLHTNTYNNETGITPQLQFLESRDAPIIENSGDYYMSVTRFSVDTGNLPVLVVEPDLDPTRAFDPHRTIHKVAVIAKDINFKLDTTGVYSVVVQDTETATDNGLNWGQSVASSDNGDVIVFSEPLASATKVTPQILDSRPPPFIINDGGTLKATGRGQVYLCMRNASGTFGNISITNTFAEVGFNDVDGHGDTLYSGIIVSDWNVGINVAISGDGNIIVMGTGAECPYIFVYNTSGTMTRINKLNSSRKSITSVATNHNGSIIVIGYPKMLGTSTNSADEMGALQIRSFNPLTNATSELYSTTGHGTQRSVGNAVSINGQGNIVAYTQKTSSASAGGTIANGGTLNVLKSADNITYGNIVATTSSKLGFGSSLSLNNAGSLIAVGAPTENTTGEVLVYPYVIGTPAITTGSVATIVPSGITGSAIGFGTSAVLSYDGAYIHIGAPLNASNVGVVQTFLYNSATPAWDFKVQSVGTTGSKYGTSIGSSQDGLGYVVGAPSTSTTHGYVRMSHINIAQYQELTNHLIGSVSMANVFWSPDSYTITTPPSYTELTGQNTATFPYYHAHSYSNFIDVVNTAIREAYVANFNRLWTEYVNLLGVANAELIKAEFINIVARCFSTPPFLEWNASLDPTLYLNNLFSAVGNYYNPTRSFSNTASATTQTSSTGVLPPLFLSLAFNASLYALFSGFPATQTTINNEKFFIINVPQQVPVLVDNSVIPLRSLPLFPDYPFLYPYYNPTTGVFSLPFPAGSTSTYSLQDYFIQLRQEISTIDAWCPISSIVFTSNQLPIILSQFSSTNTSGNSTDTNLIGNRFALVITDLMTNQQGFRPNVIYNPTAEYRRLTLTGNMGIRNIDINVFWRSKTGQLLPFRLPSGGSASIKLLFEKKDRTTKLKDVEPDVVDIMGGRMPRHRR